MCQLLRCVCFSRDGKLGSAFHYWKTRLKRLGLRGTVLDTVLSLQRQKNFICRLIRHENCELLASASVYYGFWLPLFHVGKLQRGKARERVWGCSVTRRNVLRPLVECMFKSLSRATVRHNNHPGDASPFNLPSAFHVIQTTPAPPPTPISSLHFPMSRVIYVKRSMGRAHESKICQLGFFPLRSMNQRGSVSTTHPPGERRVAAFNWL